MSTMLAIIVTIDEHVFQAMVEFLVGETGTSSQKYNHNKSEKAAAQQARKSESKKAKRLKVSSALNSQQTAIHI
eukprot:6612375-Pyramimonas_sp.AAC.1